MNDAAGWRAPPIVFVHGVLVNAHLWRKVVPRLEGFKRVTLDLPLGSHLEPLPKGRGREPARAGGTDSSRGARTGRTGSPA
jgi:pimeloyl-ACP methyl ester carboxylesterase